MRYGDAEEASTAERLQNAFYTTKQAFISKFGRKEDAHLVASDSELDSKITVCSIFSFFFRLLMTLLRIPSLPFYWNFHVIFINMCLGRVIPLKNSEFYMQ